MPRPDSIIDRAPTVADDGGSPVACEEISFPSGDSRCEGWLFRPAGAGPHPCLIMGHGFGAIRAAGLPDFARRFAAAGIAVLVFDYRHLGTSPGQPRGLIDIARQRADYRAAIAHARGLEDVDGAQIGLWGTSFSGGHVLTIAAEDPRIAAVVAMNPFVDGPPTVRATIRAAGLRNAAALGAKWAKDEIRRLRRRRPHLIELVGPPGSVAVFTTPDAEPGYTSILPEDPTGWEPAVPARILLRVGVDRPILHAKHVRCPLLVCICEHDRSTPARPALRTAQRAPKGHARLYPIGHFAPYADPWFERVISDQVHFLKQNLLPPEPIEPITKAAHRHHRDPERSEAPPDDAVAGAWRLLSRRSREAIHGVVRLLGAGADGVRR